MIDVSAPGLFTTVQDRGRPGFYAMGIAPSGALDLYSHEVANLLVGNDGGAATLEFTFVGPTLTFSEFTVIAVTGAVLDISLDGVRVPPWTCQVVRAGQTLTFGPMLAGARGYLAVRGGIDVPQVMESRSTYVLSGIGGLQGRALRAGDRLDTGQDVNPAANPRGGESVPAAFIPALHGDREIRVVGGLCDYRLTQASITELFSAPYEVTLEANRTGYRFAGPPLEFIARDAPFGAGSDPSNVVNLGYPVGSIQVPSGTELICLLRDAVTGGGYATVGTVISADLDAIAQMKAPDRAMFTQVSLQTALAERRVRRERLDRIAESMAH